MLVKLEFGVLVFVEGGKSENPGEKPSEKGKNQQQTQPKGQNRTQATLVGGECSHHGAIPTSPNFITGRNVNSG